LINSCKVVNKGNGVRCSNRAVLFGYCLSHFKMYASKKELRVLSSVLGVGRGRGGV